MRRRLLLLSAPLLSVTAWAGDAMPPAERTRVERLIRYVESRADLVFVRNGKDYNCADAATFLREKLSAMGGDVATARQFIDQIASKSSMSGEPYMVRHPDGRMEPSAKFLGDELKRIEAGH
jgi:hypothetical protein